MAHKHNRRRIRPRSRNHALSSTIFDGMLSEPGLTEVAPPVMPRNNQANKRATAPPYNRPSDLTAQHWHNRVSWQTRERQQRQEAAAKMEADQCRLFGGEPGDDIFDVDGDTGCIYDAVGTTLVRDQGRGGYNALIKRTAT